MNGTLKPSVTHYVLHYLLKDGFISSILTQNVDGLHNIDGDAERVIELHGAVSDYGLCETCHALRKVDHMQVLQDGVCPKCGVCGAILKPPVAFFEDMIPSPLRLKAKGYIDNCDVLLLVGTHCAVNPVLSYAQTAKLNGAVLVEINKTPTEATKFVDISLRSTSDDVFKEIGKEMFSGVDFEEMVCLCKE